MIAFPQGDKGRIAWQDYAMRCYLENFNLLSSTCCKMEAARSVVFDRSSNPLLFWHSAVQSTDMASLHIYPCICSVVPCLRVLWMSTHGCFFPTFSPFLSFWLSQPDAGVQEADATVDDDPYYTGGAPTTCSPLTTTWSSLGGSQAGGLRLFRSVSQFVLAILWQLV